MQFARPDPPGSSAQRKSAATAAFCATDAPSTGEVIEIVGAVTSMTSHEHEWLVTLPAWSAIWAVCEKWPTVDVSIGNTPFGLATKPERLSFAPEIVMAAAPFIATWVGQLRVNV